MIKRKVVVVVLAFLLCFLASCSSYEQREAFKIYSNRDEYVTVNCKLSYRDLGNNTTTGDASYAIDISEITAYNNGKLPPYESYGCGIPLKSANEAIENGFKFEPDDRIYQVTFSPRMFGCGWPSYIVGISCGDIVYVDVNSGILNLLDLYRDWQEVVSISKVRL